MKAIRVVEGHAQVVPERCIGDAECVRVCPQDAKVVRDDLALLLRWLEEGEEVIVTLAPSFAGCLDWDFSQLEAALKARGIAAVEETAVGAALVAKAHSNLGPGPWLTSACPAVVNLVEIYYPELTKYLAPVVSPMIAHGRLLKARYPRARVVFIGPCVAKKAEMMEAGLAGAIDAALTFEELASLLGGGEHTRGESLGEQSQVWGAEAARIFPLDGGQLATMGEEHYQSGLAISGIPECLDFLEHFDPKRAPQFTELLSCRGGCLAGPMGTSEGLWQAKQRLEAYARRPLEVPAVALELGRDFVAKPFPHQDPTEEELAQILEQMGKYSSQDELNCGACGYNSCREKAKAVHNQMAEVEMCIPNMRARAESLANLVLESTPNGIIVVDQELRIRDLNPQAEKIFGTTLARVKGHSVALLMDPVYFTTAFDGDPVAGQITHGGLVLDQYLFAVPKHKILVGIFTDITTPTQQQREIEKMREETVGRAQEVIEQQMRVAQEIAGLLGETTAQTKVLLTKLMEIIGQGGE